MITKKEYQVIREWILENTCGCIWKNFTAEYLKKEIETKLKIRKIK